MAFACRPAVIVLDEPTTGLDVSTQAHVLATVRDLCQQPRRRRAVRHPRPRGRRQPRRPRGGDVRRPDRRAGPDGGALRPTRPSVHAPPHRRRARHDRRAARSSASAAARRRRASGRSAARSRSRCEAATDECRERVPGASTRRRSATRVRCFHPRAPVPAPHEASRATGRRASCRRPTPPCARATSRRRTPGTRSCTTSTCTSRRASASPSSASRDRARPRCPARSVACTTSGPGEILLGGDVARPLRPRPPDRATAEDPVRVPEPVQLAQPAAPRSATRSPGRW